MQGNDDDRKLFHTRAGGIDFARLLEQLIPTVVIGLVIIYANSLVTQSQVGELTKQVTRQDTQIAELRAQLQSNNEKLIGLAANVTAYLGQQNTMNAAMDARLIYIERNQRAGR